MKKSFLLLLLPLFALASWAQTAPGLASSPIAWDGNSHQLITSAATPPSGYESSWVSSGYGGYDQVGGTWYHFDQAGIQYYVQGPSDPAPVDGYTTVSWYQDEAMSGTYDYTTCTATATGTYTVWYRVMRDHGASGPGTTDMGNWTSAGTVTIQAPSSNVPYFSIAPARKLGLVYNDEEQELISMANADFCSGYDNSPGNGNVLYVVKTIHQKPTPAEEAAATTTIPKRKDARTYYVYYKLTKDNGLYTSDGPWSEVGVGGIEIKQRPITTADFTVTYAEDLTFTGNALNLVPSLTWTGGIDRTATLAPNGKIEYVVQYEEETPGAPAATAEGTHAGKYKVQVVITGDANHIGFTTKPEDAKELTIKKAKYTVKEPTIGTFTYNGTKQGPLATPDNVVVVSLAGAPGSPWYAGTGRIEYSITKTDASWVTNPSNETLKRTNAGTYKIAYRTKDIPENKDFEPVEGELEFTIDKAQWNLNTPDVIADFTYDGDPHNLLNPAVEAKGFVTTDPDGVVTYTVTKDGDADAFLDGVAAADVKAQNFGTYVVSYTVAGNDNFYPKATATTIGTVKIKKAQLHLTAQGAHVNYDDPVDYHDFIVYDDFNEIPAGEDLKSNPEALKDILVKFASFDGATLDADGKPTKLPTDVGGYDFVLTSIAENYDIVLNPGGTLTIDPIDATPATVAKAEPTYNGTEQELLVVDESVLDGGKMLYYLGEKAPTVPDNDKEDEIGLWSEDIPVAKDADTYKVWYVVKADKNHNNGTPASYDVTIKPKDLDDKFFTLTPTDLVYNGADQKKSVTVTATDMNGDKNIITTEDFEETKVEYNSAVVEKLINEGTYTYTFTGKKNYTGTATATITIGKKALDAKMFTLSEDKEYNGAPQKPTITAFDAVAGDAEKNALAETDYEFVIKNSKGAEVGLDAMKNADTYTFTFKAKAGGNYKDAATAITKEWKITKKPLNASFFVLNGDNPVIFDGTDQIPGFELLATEPIVAADFTFATTNGKGEAVTEMVDADTYTYTFTATAAGNYQGEVTVDFVIDQATAEFVDPVGQVLTYNGTEQSLISEGITDAVAGVVDPTAGKVEYKVEFGGETFIDWTEDYASILAKNAGTYTVSYKFTASELNYTNPEVTGSFDVKILQANVTYRMGKQVETYTGGAFEPVEGEAYTLAAGGLFVGDEDVITFSFEEDFDATTACEEGRAFDRLVYTFKDGIANYTVGFENEGLLIIKKAAPAELVETPVAENRTYNGLAQTLVTAGKVKVVDEKPLGTIMFNVSKDGKGEYTTAVPQATDALKYDAQENRPAVWFKVVGDANHKDTEPKQITGVEIKPYELTADMIKLVDGKPLPDPYQKPYTAADQSFPMSLKVKLEADKKDPRTLGENDYTVLINGKAPKDVVIKNAGAYVYTFTGKNNYKGTISTTAYITKAELIATAPNAVKTYDGTAVIEPEEFECTATQLKLYGGLEISGLLADDKIVLGDKTIADIIVPEGSAINVGTYNLKVNLAAIPEQANYTFNAQTFDGKLTINKAPAVKIGFKKQEETVDPFWPTVDVTYKTYSKSYGTEDPVFITANGTNDVTSIAEDLDSLEGKFYEDKAYIASLLGATREPGDVYKKEGYTVKLNKLNTSNTAELAKIATFINNYKSVTFGETKFFITPYEGTIKVSIKSDAVVFDGNEHADAIAWAADLSNMVVVGLPAKKKDKKEEIFTELPTITVTPKDGKVRNAGDYNITFSGGKSDNYDLKKVQFVLGSYLTIEPYEITSDMVEIADQQAKIGDKAKDAIDHTAFEFKKPLPVVEDANLFQVVAAPRFISGDKIVVAEKPESGLILALKDKPTDAEKAEAKNYIGYDEVFGYLAVIGTPNLLVLDDKKNIETYDRENTDVTFTSRDIRQDNWNVLCLPFDATIREISDAFGYAAVDLLKKVSTDGSMHFEVTTSGTVPAGEPFIVKPTSDPELGAKKNFDQVKFTGVTIKAFSGNPDPVEDSAGNKFCGTFLAETTVSGPQFWYMSQSMWKHYPDATPVTIKGYRAYIETATAGARIFIEEPDGTITAINAIDLNNNTMDEGWYTVNGMKLNAAPTQKGTYIKDGKKVFVK